MAGERQDLIRLTRQGIQAVDAQFRALAARLSAFTRTFGPLTRETLPRFRAGVRAILAPVFGLTKAAAQTATLFTTITGTLEPAFDAPFARYFTRLKSIVTRRDPGLWDILDRKLLTGPDSDSMSLAYRLLYGPQVERARLRRALGFDPNRVWVKGDGTPYRLSDRIWRTGVDVRRQIDVHIQQALRTGEDALSLARDLDIYVNPRYAPVKYLKDGRIVREHMTLAPGRGGWGGTRSRALARTEISHAHAQATTEMARGMLGVIGLKWSLSGRHPKPDECLIAGTMIETVRGSVPIEDVALGDLVLTHLGRYQPVMQLFRHSVPDTELLRLRSRAATGRTSDLVLTRNHPVLTEQGWIPAGDLRTESRVMCLASDSVAPLCRLPHDDACITSSGFAGSVPVEDGRTCDVERYDVTQLVALHTVGMLLQDAPAPTSPLQSASDRDRWLVIRPSSLDCSHPGAVPITAGEVLPGRPTVQLCDCHSSDCLSPTWAYTPSSNTAVLDTRRTASRTSRTSAALLHDAPDSRHWNKSDDPVGSILPQMRHRTPDRSAFAGFVSPHRSIVESKSDASHNVTGAPCHSAEVESLFHSTRMLSSYINYNMVDDTTPREVEVFNIAVDQDNSYIANGVVVHNCDHNASADNGMGRGVYTVDNVPRCPAHTSCLCLLSPVTASREDTIRMILAKYQGV